MAEAIITAGADEAPVDKVGYTRGQIYRAMSLVRLSQERLFSQANGHPGSAETALDLSEALETALDFLSGATDAFEDFVERAPVAEAVAHG